MVLYTCDPDDVHESINYLEFCLSKSLDNELDYDLFYLYYYRADAYIKLLHELELISLASYCNYLDQLDKILDHRNKTINSSLEV